MIKPVNMENVKSTIQSIPSNARRGVNTVGENTIKYAKIAGSYIAKNQYVQRAGGFVAKNKAPITGIAVLAVATTCAASIIKGVVNKIHEAKEQQ